MTDEYYERLLNIETIKEKFKNLKSDKAGAKYFNALI
mgnify:CR=1 FL=1